MNRILRAAGFAVASVALTAAATYSAPSQAKTLDMTIAAPAQPSLATPAGIDAALDQVDIQVAAPAADKPVSGNLFSALWTRAAALLTGPAAVLATPERPRSLDDLVLAYAGDATDGVEQDCLAKAVYFEARGESLQGQLAVAQVVINRAASGRYPASLCKVVTQPRQFSFIDRGRFPTPDFASLSWRKAVAVARIAQARLADSLPSDVLWYHASYVAPGWGKRLHRSAQIGLHIFYS